MVPWKRLREPKILRRGRSWYRVRENVHRDVQTKTTNIRSDGTRMKIYERLEDGGDHPRPFDNQDEHFPTPEMLTELEMLPECDVEVMDEGWQRPTYTELHPPGYPIYMAGKGRQQSGSKPETLIYAR